MLVNAKPTKYRRFPILHISKSEGVHLRTDQEGHLSIWEGMLDGMEEGMQEGML